MKTSEKFVVAQIETNGRVTEHKFYIQGKDDLLITHRLRRLLEGRIQRYYDKERRETVYFHFVGMVWRPPYRLLQEIVQDRLLLQTELAGLATSGNLSHIAELDGLLRELPTPIPEKAPSDVVTRLIRHELDLRHRLNIKIREIRREQSSPVPRPYEY